MTGLDVGHTAESDAPSRAEWIEVLAAGIGSRRGNWRRRICWWFGHEYVNTIDPDTGLRLRCLRCYGGGPIPFRAVLTRVTSPGSTEATR